MTSRSSLRPLLLPTLTLLMAACGSTVVGGGGGADGSGGATSSGAFGSTGTSRGMVTGTGTSTSTGTSTVTGTSTSTGTWTSTATTTSTSTSTSSSGGAGGSPPADARPPAAGPPAPPDGAGTTTFAISKLYLGDTDRDGTPDQTNGWKQYGFDIDGKISTATSTNLCKPLDNAPPSMPYPDGYGGIDNSFGKNILPILLGLQSDLSARMDAAIDAGQTTLLVSIDALGSASDENPLAARAYLGASLGALPTFTPADAWPVDPSSLTSPSDVLSAAAQTPGSYVVGDTWVGRLEGTLTVRLLVGGATLDLPVQNPVLAMDLAPDRKGAQNGTISGVVTVAAFTAAITRAAGTIDPSLCSGPTIASIEAQVAQAADILHDGSQDPNQDCDAISVGFGFDAAAVTLGPVAPADTTPDPCP